MNYEWLGMGGILLVFAFILLAALRLNHGILMAVIALFIVIMGAIKREGPGSYTEGGI